LLTADCFCIELPGDASSKRRSRDDFDQIMNHCENVPGKLMDVECWNCRTVSFCSAGTAGQSVSTAAQFAQNIKKLDVILTVQRR